LRKKIQTPRHEDQVLTNAVPRTFSRRQFLRLAGVATAGGVLGVCTPTRLQPAPRDEGPVQLLYQDWRTEWFPRMAQHMLDEFHASHPGIRVFYSADPENFEERMLAGANFRVGMAPFPAGPARRVTPAPTDGFGIYAGTRHPEAAWELVKFLISQEYGRAMARANFLQPARASLVEEWVDFIRQEFLEKAREVDIAAFADGHLKGYSVTAEIFADMASAQPPIYEAWDQVFVLGHAEVDHLQAVCREIEEVQG
jgi:hypothetical protein